MVMVMRRNDIIPHIRHLELCPSPFLFSSSFHTFSFSFSLLVKHFLNFFFSLCSSLPNIFHLLDSLNLSLLLYLSIIYSTHLCLSLSSFCCILSSPFSSLFFRLTVLTGHAGQSRKESE